MFCTARARLSVPPPGPAVATNSIGFCGCQAAQAGSVPASTSPVADSDSKSLDEMFMVSSGYFLFFVTRGGDEDSGDPSLPADRGRNDRPFFFELVDPVFVEPVFAQHLARMFAINRRARTNLARRLRELDRKADRLHRSDRRML